MTAATHCFHIFPGFGPGGTELRITRVINGLGSDFRHSILPLNGNSEAAARIDSAIRHDIVPRPRAKSGLALWLELGRVLGAARPALLLTYNWGAIEGILPARIGSICPVIHNESGFGPDEAEGLKLSRVLARRLILNRIHATVVNSRNLVGIALQRYRINPAKLAFIRNGIDTEKYSPGRNSEARARLGLGENEVAFGFIGKCRTEKNLPFLLQAFAKASIDRARLVVVGDGPTRGELAALAESIGIARKVIFTGFIEDPSPLLNALDVFVMSSVTEQTPNALLEAMAAGLPAISTAVGDAGDMLGSSAAPVLVPSGDMGAYAEAFRAMAADSALRARLGLENRKRCLDTYSLNRMVTEFRTLYLGAAGGPERFSSLKQGTQ